MATIGDDFTLDGDDCFFMGDMDAPEQAFNKKLEPLADIVGFPVVCPVTLKIAYPSWINDYVYDKYIHRGSFRIKLRPLPNHIHDALVHRYNLKSPPLADPLVMLVCNQVKRYLDEYIPVLLSESILAAAWDLGLRAESFDWDLKQICRQALCGNDDHG